MLPWKAERGVELIWKSVDGGVRLAGGAGRCASRAKQAARRPAGRRSQWRVDATTNVPAIHSNIELVKCLVRRTEKGKDKLQILGRGAEFPFCLSLFGLQVHHRRLNDGLQSRSTDH